VALLLSFEGNPARILAHLGGETHPAGWAEPAKRADLCGAGLVFGVAHEHRPQV
jgi:hypothetical protein